MTAPDRFDVLGVGVSALDFASALEELGRLIVRGKPSYVCVTSTHGVMECQRDVELRLIHARAALVTPDGMPLVWLGRAAGHSQVERVYGPDLLLAACERSLTTGWRHYFYGGREGVAELLARRLSERYPGLAVAGTYTPPFRPLRPEEEADVERRIAASAADIVWVGLSTPKQERFMSSFVGRCPAPVLIGVGAAFDFHAGIKRQAPRLLQRSGLEWLFRALSEPRRLGPRYLVNNPLFVLYVLGERLGLRRPRPPVS